MVLTSVMEVIVTNLVRLILRAVVWLKFIGHVGLRRASSRAKIQLKSSLSRRESLQSIALETALVLCGSNLWTPHRDMRSWFAHDALRRANGEPAVSAPSLTNRPTSSRRDAPNASTPKVDSLDPSLLEASVTDLPLVRSLRTEIITEHCTYYSVQRAVAHTTPSALIWVAMPWEAGAHLEDFVTRLALCIGLNAAIITVGGASAKTETFGSSSASSRGCADETQHLPTLIAEAWSEVELLVTSKGIRYFFLAGQQLAASFCWQLVAADTVSVLAPLGVIAIDPFVGWPSLQSSAAGDDADADGVGPSQASLVDKALAALGAEIDIMTAGRIREWIPELQVCGTLQRPSYVLALDDGIWCGLVVNFGLSMSRAGADVKLDLYRTRKFAPAIGQHGTHVPAAIGKLSEWVDLLVSHAAGEASYTPSYLSNMSTPSRPSTFHSMAAGGPGELGELNSGSSSSAATQDRSKGPGLGGMRISGDNLHGMETPQGRFGVSPKQLFYPNPPSAAANSETPRMCLSNLPKVASFSSVSTDHSSTDTPMTPFACE